MAKEAGTKALDDAGIRYDEIEQAIAAYCYGDSTAGQEAIYEIGMSGIPIVNVNNNCSTGSSALFLGRQLIAGGMADCVMAIGFEKMEKGSARDEVPRPAPADEQAARPDDRAARLRAVAARRPGVRQRRPRAHGALRHDAPSSSPRSATRTTSTR